MLAYDDIGIVVIGRNEGKRLISCLVSVKAETNKIVYVDSGSTDDSVLAAERIGVSVTRLDLTLPFTAARARNDGFGAIKRLWPYVNYVQFIDGDCELVHGWLEAALAFMKQEQSIAIVCGRRRERHPEQSVYNRLCDLEWDTPVGETTACGGDSLIRVSAFEMVGGYQPQLIAGEEPELCVRLRENGWKIWRLNAEMTRHDAAMIHFSQWWIRAVRSGCGYAQVAWLHRGSQFGIWRKDTRAAIFWGAVVPAVTILGAIVHPAFAGVALVYPLQICRMAFARKPNNIESWISALFIMLAQFAAFRGILRFCWSRWRRRTVGLIEYKQAG